ncbi:MAG: coproporphyrinogen dehydrogenase HemZ [Oscillospiraceae bacterium]|nr:coproporphyrinogen dehydrogenase HemZ [Oscillospiraceae bacterium]
MMEDRRYALVFRGHHFGYEVQATAKIFIPGVRFVLCEDGREPEDVPNCITTELCPGESLLLHVSAVLDGKAGERSCTLAADSPEADQEFTLCRLLYDLLRDMTGYTPPWGLLTGIRPVRKVIQCLDAGMTTEQAAASLRERYLISPEKMQLAVDTALVQHPILPHSPKEIGLYISIPFCPTRCSYCSFVSHSMETAKALIPGYVEKLCEEIAVYGKMIPAFGLQVQSVYIGGGTPTAISAQELRQVMEAVATHIDIGHAREYTVEAGRADTITREKLAVIREMGATRISVNPQTLQDNVLEVIGRKHTARQAVDAFLLARDMGFEDINMDLIAGLPTDTYEGFSDTLRRVMALAPDSITVHTLTLKRAADLYRTETADGTIAQVERMAALSAKALPEGGWRPYYLYRQKNTVGNLENVGYAKPGKENLYNILIMDETQTILGAGCGASTKVVLPDGDITRILNYKFPYEYIDRFEKMMEKKQTLREVLAKLSSS